ncbi:MAG: AI-2E family transporter [Acidimicrobiia bacterium]
MTSERLQKAALIIWIAVGVVILGFTAIQIAGAVRVIWLPIAFAAGLVFLLDPVVGAFERLRIPRPVSVLFSLIVLLALVVAILALVFPTVREQALEFVDQLPALYLGIFDWLRGLAARLGYDLDTLISQGAIEDWLADPTNQETLRNLLFGFGAGAGQLIRGVTEAIVVVGLAPILAVYILIDLERFKASAVELTPDRYRDEVSFLGSEVVSALGSFVRGQLLVALIVGVASSFGMWLIDLPFWLLIGILAGILNLVPFVGPVVGGALAMIVALLSGNPIQAVWAVLIFILIQQVDNHVITPLVQRTRVHLSPLVIVLALIVGGTLAGLLGVLVAVPTTAAVRILLGHFWRTRILGQSWREASEAMIEVTEPPERLARLGRRSPEQSRLFDTQELRPVAPVEPEPESEAEEG